MRVVMLTLLMLAALLSVTADVTNSIRHHRNDVIDDGKHPAH